MGIKWKGNASPKALQRKYFAKKAAMARAATGALGRAADVLERSIKSRVFPAKAVSQQDAPANRPIKLAGRSPVSTRIRAKERKATVTVARHWTAARTKGVKALFSRFGQESALFRKSLVVKLRKAKGKNAAGKRRKGLRRVSGPAFAVISLRDKGLAKWAKRVDKGRQELRHVVRLQKPEIIRGLEIEPSVNQSAPTISGIFRDAARKGFLA